MSFVVQICSLHWILLTWIKKDGGVRRPCKERKDLGKPAFDGRITFLKTNYKGICLGYFQLVQDRDKKLILVKMIANSRVPRNFLTSSANISF
jgi:hypothetical protein